MHVHKRLQQRHDFVKTVLEAHQMGSNKPAKDVLSCGRAITFNMCVFSQEKERTDYVENIVQPTLGS